MSKSFLFFEDQIDHLENEKNLIISDHDHAIKMLKQIGYFSLIDGYKTPFKNPTTKKHYDGTTLEDIVALYQLDASLRELVSIHGLSGQLAKNIRMQKMTF